MFVTTVLLIIITLAFFICYILYRKNFNYWKNKNLLPYVHGRILSSNLKDIFTFKTNFAFQLREIYDDPAFSDASAVGVYGIKPILLIRHPDLIKSILVQDFDYFRNRSLNGNPDHDPIGSRLLLLAKYDFWKESRAKLSPIFTSAKLKQMYPLFQEVGESLEDFLQKKGNRFVYEFKQMAILYTTDVVASTVFGIKTNSLQNPSGEVTQKMQKLSSFNIRRALNFFILAFMPQLSKFFGATVLYPESVDFIKAYSADILRDREKSGLIRNDIVDVFLKQKQEAEAKGADMKDFMNGIASHTAMFVAGGFETTSSTIANLMYELAKQPKIQLRLRNEIMQAYENENGSISFEAIHDLEYLNMCMAETLRMYPIFPVLDRRCEKSDAKAANYSLKPYYEFEVPDGMAVYISIFGLHYDPRYWPNPKIFDPERFSSENKKSIRSMTYLPFGAGPRNCIGMRLGQLELKTFVVQFLRNHCVQVCAATKLEAEFDAKSFVLHTVGGVNLEVVRI